MYSTCSSSTKAATSKALLGCLALLCMLAFACNSGQGSMARLQEKYAGQLLQVRKTTAGSVSLQLLPGTDRSGEQNGYCNMRIVLNGKSGLHKKTGMMQYLNFTIKNSFYVVSNRDTVLPAICERIPGANENEFLYLACFDKQKLLADKANARLYIADSIAGFGDTEFTINQELLKQLEAIKN